MSATLLLVEDEPQFRRSLRAFLEDSEYCVLEAANGREALDLFQRHRPALVLTDLRMPAMDGIELLTHLKSLCPDVPVLVLSGTGDTNALMEASRRGAYACFSKPLGDTSELVRAIGLALSEHKP
jgi:DNA-binding NarL/FixJ family response regulator